MDRPPHDWTPSPSPLQHHLHTESRLTRLEVTSEQHGETIEDHTGKLHSQDVWNKGFTVALAGLGSGLAHAKAGDVIDLLLTVLRLK